MDCTRDPAAHVKLNESDQSKPTHLQLTRKIAAGASIDLDVCDADFTIKGGKDDLLRLSVDFDNGAPKLAAGDYLQTLDITPQNATVQLYLPRHPQAKVIIVLPAGTPAIQVNLVRGGLFFQTERISGQSKINVVDGHVELLGNADSYSSLHASVFLVGYHDRRKDKDDAHGMVSKSLSGSGAGSIDVNVVRGSLELRARD